MKKSLIIFLAVFVTVSLIADCRLFVMMAKEKDTLSDSGELQSRFNQALEELQNQGDGDNPDGWGLLYYNSEDNLIDQVWRGEEQAFGSNEYDSAQVFLRQQSNAHLAMGHVRNGTTGGTDIEDPHPFVFNNNDIDYSFAHNGTVDKNDVRDLIEANDNNLSEAWLTTHSPNTHGHGDWENTYVWEHYVVDSEIYFLWIMLNLHLNDYNIYEGLHSALNGMAGIDVGENRNFVFSDGTDIYAYRYSTDNRLDHNLKYKWNEADKYWIVMSELPSFVLTEEEEMIPDDALLYLSPTGKSVLFGSFSIGEPTISHKRMLKEGWNWEAFSVFPTNTDDGQIILQNLVNYGITDVDGVDFVANYGTLGWDINFYFNNTQFYKIKLTNDTPELPENNAFFTLGIMRDPSLPNAENIIEGNLYWIGYNLLPSQNIEDAFGSNWDKVSKVWAQDWYFDKQYNERDGSAVPSNSTTGKTMEFGKGYIVEFIDSFTSLTWHYPHQPTRTSVPIETKFFTYEETPTYEVKDVMTVDSVEDIIEIGVFQDGVCKGATVVDELPVQILAYTDPEGGDLTFQVATESRATADFTEYSILDKKSNTYQMGSLSPRTQLHSIIKLGKGEYNVIEVSSKPELNQNYPNPFNPVTEISFNLKEASKVKLEVFNIKGQKIKTLRVAYLDSGNHSVTWSGKDDTGNSVSSGIYMYKLTTNQVTQTKRMILLK